jgi:hypothetical protein
MSLLGELQSPEAHDYEDQESQGRGTQTSANPAPEHGNSTAQDFDPSKPAHQWNTDCEKPNPRCSRLQNTQHQSCGEK